MQSVPVADKFVAGNSAAWNFRRVEISLLEIFADAADIQHTYILPVFIKYH